MVRVEVVALGCDTSVVVFRQRVERSVESARLAEGERLDLGDPGGELRLEREIRAVQPYETDRRSGRHVSPANMRCTQRRRRPVVGRARTRKVPASGVGARIPPARRCPSVHAGRVTAVWLVTGAQASGKSTVADLLARRFDRGVHVRGGQFYCWAVRGWVHVGDPDEREARRLLDLRYRLSALVANEYAAAGFTTVVQDNIYGADVERWLDAISAGEKHLVVLRPTIHVVEARDAHRQRTIGKVAYRGGFTPAINDQHVASTRQDLGLWLDTSDLSPEETVDVILTQADQARVP